MRRDIADRLQIKVCNRIRKENPDEILTKADVENIWYTIYGKLCRGESEEEVEQWCDTVPISKKSEKKYRTRGYC